MINFHFLSESLNHSAVRIDLDSFSAKGTVNNVFVLNILIFKTRAWPLLLSSFQKASVLLVVMAD